ncbi:MAG: uracil-DNA glycosylase [Nitrospiraceae bacterium]|nr:uracil-DNA glycosylase [Nitrospiraceae bacterium]
MQIHDKEIINNIRTVLKFYQALGLERLPLNLSVNKSLSIKTQEIKKQSAVVSSSAEKAAALEELRKELENCQRCRLSRERKNIVIGEGSLDADIMFIGEGPGREEDIQGRPFVGDAGQILTRLIEKMGFKRENVYIGNIVKCRPPMNRDPEEDEIAACLPFVQKQIEIISPKIIISLGRISAHTLTESKIPITKLRGNFSKYGHIPLMPTFHPAYLLRNPKEKWRVWEDAQRVLEKLKEIKQT